MTMLTPNTLHRSRIPQAKFGVVKVNATELTPTGTFKLKLEPTTGKDAAYYNLSIYDEKKKEFPPPHEVSLDFGTVGIPCFYLRDPETKQGTLYANRLNLRHKALLDEISKVLDGKQSEDVEIDGTVPEDVLRKIVKGMLYFNGGRGGEQKITEDLLTMREQAFSYGKKLIAVINGSPLSKMDGGEARD